LINGVIRKYQEYVAKVSRVDKSILTYPILKLCSLTDVSSSRPFQITIVVKNLFLLPVPNKSRRYAAIERGLLTVGLHAVAADSDEVGRYGKTGHQGSNDLTSPSHFGERIETHRRLALAQ